MYLLRNESCLCSKELKKKEDNGNKKKKRNENKERRLLEKLGTGANKERGGSEKVWV